MKVSARRLALLASPLLVSVACSSGVASRSASDVRAASSTPAAAPASPAAPASVGQGIAVALDQWSVTQAAAAGAGGVVTFTVTNAGNIAHEFVVLRTDTPAGSIPVASFEGVAGRIDEETAGTNVGETGDMAPGAVKALRLTLKPGHYALVCNLPGHYGQGMHSDFTV